MDILSFTFENRPPYCVPVCPSLYLCQLFLIVQYANRDLALSIHTVYVL